MVPVEQSVGGLAVPVDTDHEARVQSPGDPVEDVDPEPPRTAALDPSDQRLRDIGSSREVDLAPAPVHSERADHSTNPNDVHPRRVANARYSPLIERSLR